MQAASLQDTCGGAGVGTGTDFSVGGGRVGSQRLSVWQVRARPQWDWICPWGLVPRAWVAP